MLVYADRTLVGTVGGGAMESRVVALCQEVMLIGKPCIETFTLNNVEQGDVGICGGTAQIFIEPIQQSPSLIVIGGGHVGKALAELGLWMGFRVTLVDDRPEFANDTYIPNLHRYIVCKPAEVTQKLTLDQHSYVCAVTRGLPVDLPLLPSLLATNAAYIGLIGSKRRWAITSKALREQHQVSEADLARIHSPIGLEIGAETPREIALSILSEITLLRRKNNANVE